MIIYPYGSSHCRNVFCEETFGCSNAESKKAQILNKWIPKGLQIKDADMNGVNERSMSRFLEEVKKGKFFGDAGTIRCYMYGEIDIRVNIMLSPGSEDLLQKNKITKHLTIPYIDSFMERGLNNNKTIILAVQPPMFADREELKNNYMYRWDDKLSLPDPRAKWTKYMNDSLEEMCKENNMTFFDPWTSYKLDENGFLPIDQCDGICHIKDASVALEEIMSFIYNKFIIT